MAKYPIEVSGKCFEVPEPAPRALKTWQKVLKHHENRMSQNLEMLCQVDKEKDYLSVIKNQTEMVKQIKIPIRSRERLDIMKRMLLLMMAEEYLYSQIGRVSDYLKDTTASIDELSDGLWIDHVSNLDAEEFLKGVGNQRIVPSQKIQV
jgi:hypothetical protein